MCQTAWISKSKLRYFFYELNGCSCKQLRASFKGHCYVLEAASDNFFDLYKTRPKVITNLVYEQLIINDPQQPDGGGVYFSYIVALSDVIILGVLLLSIMIVIMLGFEQQTTIKLWTSMMQRLIMHLQHQWHVLKIWNTMLQKDQWRRPSRLWASTAVVWAQNATDLIICLRDPQTLMGGYVNVAA